MPNSPEDNDLLDDLDEDLDDEDGPAPTPFDHPLFLPVLFVAFALWFGYDGWFSTTIEAVGFNRVMFFIWVICALYFGRSGLRELREDREREAAGDQRAEPRE